jgi:hypothetical protein
MHKPRNFSTDMYYSSFIHFRWFSEQSLLKTELIVDILQTKQIILEEFIVSMPFVI